MLLYERNVVSRIQSRGAPKGIAWLVTVGT